MRPSRRCEEPRSKYEPEPEPEAEARQPAVSVRSQRSRDREAEQSMRSGSTVATHLAEMGEYAVLS